MARELTQERIQELFIYDPETGVFTRRVDVRRARTRAGDVVGTPTSHGYRQIGVDGTQHYSHRLAWLYMYGEFPEGKLDHHDQDKTNNRISNLRPSTNSQNSLNQGPRTNNTSGHVGVYWHKEGKKWLAQIVIDRKNHYLGFFTNLEDAIAARKAGEIALGVSEFCPQGETRMSYRARGSTETFPTARQAAERALGTATVIYIALDMFMDMQGRTCIVESV